MNYTQIHFRSVHSSQSGAKKRTLRCFLTFAFAIAISIITMSNAASAEPSANSPSEQQDTTDRQAQDQGKDKANLPDSTQQEQAERKHSHMHKHNMFLITEAAGIIGVAPDKLKKELKDGKSIAEVAKSKGIAEAELTNQLVAIKARKIDEAVKSGKWTAEKAEKMKEKLPDHIRHMLNHKGFHKSRESVSQE
ncbi:MAG: hypothetical protein K0Q73_8795 [Paenibacillus sp.]|jgi:hypothetical protein|nr:hypothetical protein [Paenibacillus sp.]